VGVNNEKRHELIEAIGPILMEAGVINYSITEVAERVIDKIIEEGWQWHPKPIPPLASWEIDLLDNGPWKDLTLAGIVAIPPGKYEINESGQIRNSISKLTVSPELDAIYLRELVTIKYGEKDSDWVKIDGPQLAKELFKPAEPEWVRIPGYKDYEVNSLGIVRNFWTKRTLGEYWEDPDKQVELHAKDGSPFVMTLQAIILETFGEDWNKK